MAKNEERTMQVADQEEITNEDLERTRERQCFVPRTDIYETEHEMVVITDVPGVDQDSIEITLENNILTIEAYSLHNPYSEFDLVYSEYTPGDFQRSFRISSEIDGDKIEASVNHGALRMRLPKKDIAKTKKIKVHKG
jgi:HSP20 family protein